MNQSCLLINCNCSAAAFEKILTTSTFPLHFKSEILSEKLPENIVYATMHVQLLIFRHY